MKLVVGNKTDRAKVNVTITFTMDLRLNDVTKKYLIEGDGINASFDTNTPSDIKVEFDAPIIKAKK